MHNTIVKCKSKQQNEKKPKKPIYIDKETVLLVHVHTRGIITGKNKVYLTRVFFFSDKTFFIVLLRETQHDDVLSWILEILKTNKKIKPYERNKASILTTFVTNSLKL